MGKNKKNNNTMLYELRKELEEGKKELKKIESKKERIKAMCCHVDEKGKSRIHTLNQYGDVKCNICDTKFNVAVIEPDKIQEASNILHNVVNQIKVYSSRPEEELELLKGLGEIPLQVKAIIDLYTSNVLTSGNKKSREEYNNYHSPDNYNGGLYGSAALDLFSPEIKKKNKNKEKKKNKFY